MAASNWRRTLWAAVLASMLLSAIAAYHRTPWDDEGWFSSAAYNLARHGFLGTTVLDPVDMHLTRIDRRTYWVMPLYLLGQALWLKLFPPTLLVVRSFTLLWIPLAVSSLYRFLRRVSANARAATLAACLLAFSFIFIDNAGFARPDLMCCALGLSGLAAYVEWREKHFHRALIGSNALIAASILTHPNGVFHAFGLAVLIMYYDRRRLNLAALGAAALPYVVFGGAWAVYIAQDFSAFADQLRGNGTNGRWTTTLNPALIFWNELRLRYVPAFGLATRGWALMKLVALAAYVAAIAGSLFQPGFRTQRSTRLVLILMAVYFLGLSVFNQKLSYYLIHILPWYVALTALYAEWLWGKFPALRAALALGIIGLVGVETGGILLKSQARSKIIPEEQTAIDYARSHSRPQDRIVGSAALIYGFGFDTRLQDDPRLGSTSGKRADLIIADPIYRDFWQEAQPADKRAVKEALSHYQLAFDNGTCQVYVRRPYPRASC